MLRNYYFFIAKKALVSFSGFFSNADIREAKVYQNAISGKLKLHHRIISIFNYNKTFGPGPHPMTSLNLITFLQVLSSPH